MPRARKLERTALNPVIIIPARMQAQRLPGKPLLDIAGTPLIQHVVNRGRQAALGKVFVATDAPGIARAVSGAQVVMTRKSHASGSDRAFEAIEKIDPAGTCETILLLQGDLPTIDAPTLQACCALMDDARLDIGTVAAPIVEARERDDPDVVKVVGTPDDRGRMRAYYFTRATAPWGEGPLYHHIGVYAWRRQALARFVALPRSVLERRERLEQLRALEAGMRIGVALVDRVPASVDTPADLARVRALLSKQARDTGDADRHRGSLSGKGCTQGS